MRKLLALAVLCSFASGAAFAQADSSMQAAPAKPAAAAKPKSKKPGEPTAVFETTAGTLRCQLFEKETPITV